MNRASHGGLEVERYIGSCLISSTVRPNLQKTLGLTKKHEQPQSLVQHNNSNNNLNSYSTNNYSPGTDQCQYGNWTVSPLVSMTSSPRRNNQRSSPLPCQQSQQQQQQQQQQLHIDQSQHHLQSRSPLSRLAIHTQGAPLIVTGRFNNRGKIQNCGNTVSSGTNVNNYCNVNSSLGGMTMSISRCMPQRGQRPIETSRKFQQQQQHQLNTKTDCQASKADNTSITNIANIDSLSIASDESSNNSENSLPRIIKPRKRRKKDRKPTNTQTNETTKQDEQIVTRTNSDQLNSVTSKSYGPVNYEIRYDPSLHRLHRRPPVGRESYTKTQTSSSVQEIVDTRQRFAHRHVQVKVLDDNRNIVVDAPIRTMSIPKGYRNYHHHLVNNNGNRVNINNNNNIMHNNNNNNVNGKNISHYIEHYNSGCERTDVVDDAGSCQCRYCDPSGLIWDVDQHVYSPYLTPSPPHTEHNFNGVHYPHLPLFMSRSNLDSCHEQIEYFDVEDPHRIHHHQQHQQHHQQNPNYHQQQQQQHRHQQQQHASSVSSHQERLESSGCPLLRRSWSDPTSYFSDQIISAPIRDVGVIGDRGQTADIPRGRSSWPGSTSSGITSLGTSLPGLSSIPNSTTPTQSLEVSTEIVTSLNGHRDIEIKFYSSSPNAVNTEEEKSSYLDDNEDFSDIWSYHESKLQQDFHTLLQAEE